MSNYGELKHLTKLLEELELYMWTMWYYLISIKIVRLTAFLVAA